jgi:2-polyprenyl-3-methyl-5-hydroxy-6-metoxy-1,4-benzoquinol methylase
VTVAGKERLNPRSAEEADRLFHEARYQFASQRIEGLRVMDAACGVGYGSEILAEAGARWVTGVDFSEDAVAYAATHYSSRQTQFLRADVNHLPFASGVFDLVVSFETIEHLSDPDRLLQEFVRCLKNDGKLILSTPNASAVPPGSKHSPFHAKEFELMGLTRLLGTYFKSQEMYWQPWPAHAIGDMEAAWNCYRFNRIPGAQVVKTLLPPRIRRRFHAMLAGASKSRSDNSLDYTPCPIRLLTSEREACVYVVVCSRQKA